VAKKCDSTKQFFGELRHPNDTRTVPFEGGMPEELHLFIDIPAMIFGMTVSSRGIAKNGISAGKVLVDQILHVDIGDTEIYLEETGTTEDISIRHNTYLTGLFKPGSGIFNLDPVISRKINIATHSVHMDTLEIKCNNLLFMQGDVPHGGVTYDRDEPEFNWRPSFHFYIMSTHHDKDVDILEIDSVGIGNYMPIHAERLSITHKYSIKVWLAN